MNGRFIKTGFLFVVLACNSHASFAQYKTNPEHFLFSVINNETMIAATHNASNFLDLGLIKPVMAKVWFAGYLKAKKIDTSKKLGREIKFDKKPAIEASQINERPDLNKTEEHGFKTLGIKLNKEKNNMVNALFEPERIKETGQSREERKMASKARVARTTKWNTMKEEAKAANYKDVSNFLKDYLNDQDQRDIIRKLSDKDLNILKMVFKDGNLQNKLNSKSLTSDDDYKDFVLEQIAKQPNWTLFGGKNKEIEAWTKLMINTAGLVILHKTPIK